MHRCNAAEPDPSSNLRQDEPMSPRTMVACLVGVSAACLAYAVARYVVLGEVSVAQVPLFVCNKAVSMVALWGLGVAAASRVDLHRRWAGRTAVIAASLHALMTLCLLNPEYFPKLYAPGGGPAFTALGGLSLLAGCVGLVLVLVVRAQNGTTRFIAMKMPITLLALIAIHCTCLGWKSWSVVDTWPGGLPPITLLASVYATGAVVVAVIRR